MAKLEARRAHPILVRHDQPLIGIPGKEKGEEVVQYFTDEQGVDDVSTSASLQRALSLAGAWSELGDWNAVLDELDRIRHESNPTPQFRLLA